MAQERNCQICGRVIYFEGICYECRQRKKREGYQSLSEQEIPEKINKIIEALGDSFYNKEEYDDFFGLLAYRNISTEAIAQKAIRAEVYYPCELYRDARPSVLEKLIEILSEPNCKQANHIIQCLAVAGGDDVLAAFIELEKNPRAWSKNLYVPPSVYAMAGGWTFGQNGIRIELNYNRCFPVLPSSDDINPDTAVLVSSPRKDVCPGCGSRLIDILTIDGRDDRLAFLKLDGNVRIPICPVCSTMCERTVVRYNPDGDSLTELVDLFENGNDPDEYRISDEEYLTMTAKKFALAKQPESLFFACGCDECITIGGFADWIQDFQYDPCPDCGNTMKYFASVPWSALSDYSEGTLFLEICTDCRIISVFHQQT